MLSRRPGKRTEARAGPEAATQPPRCRTTRASTLSSTCPGSGEPRVSAPGAPVPRPPPPALPPGAPPAAARAPAPATLSPPPTHASSPLACPRPARATRLQLVDQAAHHRQGPRVGADQRRRRGPRDGPLHGQLQDVCAVRLHPRQGAPRVRARGGGAVRLPAPSVRLSSPTRSTRTHGPRLPAAPAPAPRAQAESDMAFTALVAAAEKKQ